MKCTKSILPFSVIVVVLILASVACKKINQEPTTDQKTTTITLDTSKIEEALRKFSALPPGTKGKAAILDTIRMDAIAMGYNEQACYLAMDLARGQADRGNLDSARFYFEEARPFCFEP